MSNPQLHVNLLRLDTAQLADLLERLEPNAVQGGECPPHERRREPRWVFRRSDIVAELEQPGGGVARFLVVARNLSANGLAFIHGGFVHPGTRAQYLLPCVDEPSRLVRGVVIGCRHVEGPLHEVRVRFDQPIEPRDFLNMDQLVDGLAGEATTVTELSGRVLLMTDAPVTVKAVTHALSPTRIDLALARSLDETRELLDRQRVDVLLLDLHDDRYLARRSVDEMRRVDLDPPLLVMTADRHEPFLTAVVWEGADHVIAKPLQAQALYDVLLQLHQQKRSFV